MLKVLEPGELRAGDEIEIVYRPDHGLTITDLAVGAPPDRARRLLDSGLPLAPTVRAKLRRIVNRAATH
jgi:MOSC domain-containing protein YiiM